MSVLFERQPVDSMLTEAEPAYLQIERKWSR